MLENFRRDSFEIAENKIQVQFASIDTSRTPVKQFPLQLDTGAFITLINKGLAVLNGYPVMEEKSCIISGFSEKGMWCDLRIIPVVIFCGFELRDVIVATPHEDGVIVTEVLGMNILENFDFTISLSTREIFAAKRGAFDSQNPKYRCGSVNLLV